MTVLRLVAIVFAVSFCVSITVPAHAQHATPTGPTPLFGLGTVIDVGGGVLNYAGPCMSPAEEAFLWGLAQPSILAGPQPFGPLPPFEFYPMGARLWHDVIVTNYNDIDPGPGILAWDCSDHTYDRHDASDVALRSFGEQSIGVPVFAAQSGVVLAAIDGHADTNTCGGTCGSPSNLVSIDHGGGRICHYLHLKNGSIPVSVGDLVAAGQQIGLTASSGYSTAPHLHFANYEFGQPVEPWFGNCDTNSRWANQVDTPSNLFAFDLGLTTDPIGATAGVVPPAQLPTQGYYVFNTEPLTIWVKVMNIPDNADYFLEYVRPNGQVAFSFNGSFGNVASRFSWWWLSGWAGQMNTEVGEWKVRLTIAGTMVEAPFTVVATQPTNFNSPPAPIVTSLEPAMPQPDDVVFCNVTTSQLNDDPDYDIVRFRYVWDLDGVVIRDVTSAGQADAVPAGALANGGVVTCTVTPSDGVLEGTPVAVSGTVLTDSMFDRGDCNGDGSFNIGDPVATLNSLFGGGPAPRCDDACDANDDGSVNIGDPVQMLSTLFVSGQLPPAPYGSCGVDPTPDPLDCATFDPCP